MKKALHILLAVVSIIGAGAGQLRAASQSQEQAITGDLVHDHGASLVIVTGDEGAGSGFICKNGNSTFLYTNIHIIADLLNPSFTRLDGVAVATGATNVSAGRDIARINVKNPPGNPLEAVANFDESVRIGDDVIVLGNSGGGGVVTALKGALVGIGPDRIEVSAKFIPGNSGSPIIHVKTGKVIGIATYLTVRREDPTKGGTPTVRRFGFRIDNAAKWEGVDWTLFRQDADGVKQVAALTTDIFNFLRALATKRAPDFATETLRQPATEWMKMMRNHQLSLEGRRGATTNFLHAMQRIIAADVLSVEPKLRYTYFRDEMHEQREIRRHLYDEFNPDAMNL
jgi:hypothetical protein